MSHAKATDIAYSLDGCLRLIQFGRHGEKGCVQIRAHLYPGDWSSCVYRQQPFDDAKQFFWEQAIFHVDRHRFFQPVVEPGK